MVTSTLEAAGFYEAKVTIHQPMDSVITQKTTNLICLLFYNLKDGSFLETKNCSCKLDVSCDDTFQTRNTSIKDMNR
jgi:hypothetical protein